MLVGIRSMILNIPHSSIQQGGILERRLGLLKVRLRSRQSLRPSFFAPAPSVTCPTPTPAPAPTHKLTALLAPDAFIIITTLLVQHLPRFTGFCRTPYRTSSFLPAVRLIPEDGYISWISHMAPTYSSHEIRVKELCMAHPEVMRLKRAFKPSLPAVCR